MKEEFTLTEGFRKKSIVLNFSNKLKKECLEKPLRLMHVCGTHENSIAKFGIRELLPENLTVIAGPGCPVCVCPVQDIEAAKHLALNKGLILVTFGDMMMVPTPNGSLMDVRAEGGDIRMAYSPFDVIEIAKANPGRDVVFFAVGFETTACGVASLFKEDLPENLSFLVSHRLIPPALDLLLKSGEIEIDGLILPGHVSAVIGLVDYIPIIEQYKLPAVAVGFEPVDVMMGLSALLEQIRGGKAVCENSYTRAIREEGNPLAKKAMEDAFDISDAHWRGIGAIPGSGFKLKERFKEKDARLKYDIPFDEGAQEMNPGCSCHKVMLGKIEPDECPLFSKTCTPDKPLGPCMVSFEGTCKTWYRYRREVGSH